MNFLFLILVVFVLVFLVKNIYEWITPKLEHLVVKQSKIKGAGRGVFAEKNYKKGDVIESCPYIHDNSDNINGKLVNYYIDGTSLDKNHVIYFEDYAQYIIMMLMPIHIMNMVKWKV